MTFRDQGRNGANRGTRRNAKDIRIRKRVAQKRLETCASDRQGGAHDDGEQDARQADVQDDHAVVSGDRAGLVKHQANQVAAEAIERDLDSAEFERDHDHYKENDGENSTAKEKPGQCQRAHLDSREQAVALESEANGFARGLAGAGELAGGAALSTPGASANTSGCNWRARSSMTETMRGAGRTMASLTTAILRLWTASRMRHPGRFANAASSLEEVSE